MKYNFWKSLGFLILMSLFLAAGYSNIRAQNKQTTCDNKKADKFLQQGQTAYDKKDYGQALSFYDQAAKAAPKCPVPYFYKGGILVDSKKYDEGIAAYQEALKRNFIESFRVYYGICASRLEQSNYTEAIKNCEESVRLNDNFFWSSYDLARAYFELKNYDKALVGFSRAAQLDPNSASALQMKAGTLLELQRYNEALVDLMAVTKLNPTNEGAFFGVGAAYFQLKNFSKAVEYLTQSVKLNPDFFEAWMILASAHIGNSINWEKSEEAAFQAVRLRPNDGDANFKLGLAQLINGKLEGSLKSFDAAIKNKSTLIAAAIVYKGYALIGLKRTVEAEKLFEQALSVKPVNKTDYFSLAEIFFYRWDLEKAREQLKKGINFAADDEDWQEYSILSWSYSLSNEPQQAIIAANEAIQLNPTNSEGYTNRCRAYNDTNLPDIAIKDCQKSLALKPNDGEVFFYLGRAYALKKDAAQEKSYNQKSILLMEKRIGFSFNKQKSEQPIQSLPESNPSSIDRGKVSVNSPSYTYYLYLLGNAYFLDNNFEAAIGAYQKVLELRPRFPRLRYNLAAAYLSLKRPDLKNADAQYTALLQIDSKLAADLKKVINGYRRKK